MPRLSETQVRFITSLAIENRSQSHRQMSRTSIETAGEDDDIAATAIAAAAFAIDITFRDSTETTGSKSITSISQEDLSLTRAKFRKEKARTYQSPEQDAASSRLSGEGSILKGEGTSETKPRSLDKPRGEAIANGFSDTLDSMTLTELPPPPPPPPHLRPSQSNKKPASMNSDSMGPKSSPPTPSKPPAPSSVPQPKPASGPSSSGGTKADVWEKIEMEKIKERYDKLKATIDSWEENKKKKAKAKLDKTETEPAKRRSKALEKFRDEMESIKQIAGEARAQAEERKRKEELKARKKANMYRRTGKFPKTCFCF